MRNKGGGSVLLRLPVVCGTGQPYVWKCSKRLLTPTYSWVDLEMLIGVVRHIYLDKDRRDGEEPGTARGGVNFFRSSVNVCKIPLRGKL